MVRSALETETLAQLYLQQGFPERAALIFESLLAEDPERLSLVEGLSACRAALVAKQGEYDMGKRVKLQVLQRMLARLTGQSDPGRTQTLPKGKSVTDPRRRRLSTLRSMLQRLTQGRV